MAAKKRAQARGNRRKGQKKPSAKLRASRARARRDRVWHIAQLMASGEWERGQTGPELAKQWGLSPATLKTIAAEASHIVDLTTKQRAKLVKLARMRLSQIAVEDGNDRVPALRTLLDHLGEMPRRYEHSGPAGAPIEVDSTARLVVMLPDLEPDDDEPAGEEEATKSN